MYKIIKPAELFKSNNATIVDVREPYEYEMGSIPGAINIPLDIIIDNFEKYLKIDKSYYIYCETSLRSSRVCEFLADLGYNVYLIEGGYKAWSALNNKK